MIRGRFTPGQREKTITSTAIWDGKPCRIRIPQDPGGAGKFEAHHLVGLLQGHTVSVEREEDSKEGTAPIHSPRNASTGFVKLLEGPWNQAFVDELCAFPAGAHDDQVDAATAAFRALLRRPRHYYVAA